MYKEVRGKRGKESGIKERKEANNITRRKEQAKTIRGGMTSR